MVSELIETMGLAVSQVQEGGTRAGAPLPTPLKSLARIWRVIFDRRSWL